MTPLSATALSHPNIAFIKYWGNRDEILRLPWNDSISMNLEELVTRTRVTFDAALNADELILNGARVEGAPRARVSALLDETRRLAGLDAFAAVESENNFPTGAGIASSAAAFSALAVASAAAAGLSLSEAALSRLARLGSGSASRSVPGGFTLWQKGESDEDSYAYSLAPASHWALADCIAVINQTQKPTGSTQGHRLAATSPLQRARIADAPRRVEICRRAILTRDFDALAEIAEEDSNLMHAVMMTSSPPLFYWLPATLRVMNRVRVWRSEGQRVFYTIDAGPNVHVICPLDEAEETAALLRAVEGVERVLVASVGGAARLLD